MTDRSDQDARALNLATAVVVIAGVVVAGTLRIRRGRQHGKGTPGPLHVDASTTINRPVADVYGYWRDFVNLPSFMLHLESVTVDESGVSHWRAKAPIKKSVTWDAEMTGDEPNRRISWRSLDSSDIDNAGTVHFETAPDGASTEVRVSLHYDVPGGAIGRAVAKLLGEEPEQQVRDDLRRFKQVLETGDIVRSDGLLQGTDARHQVVQRPAQPAKNPKQKGDKR